MFFLAGELRNGFVIVKWVVLRSAEIANVFMILS